MNRYIIFLLIVMTTVITVRAQRFLIVENQMVLRELISNNESFLKQLDSVLFIGKSAILLSDRSKDRKIKEKYVFFTNVKKSTSGNYLISILYGKPTWVEKDLNTGIYKLKDYYFIINEHNSQTPLFKVTGHNVTFKYEKEVWKRNNNEDSIYLDEVVYAEEFSSWYFSYSNNQLKEISRDEYLKSND